ncbi:MAG TPA: hypothetical protein VKQ32_29760 [Polyangia bacterium]|nr:hypothetical protein [Polyangia bacterium]
MPAPRRCRIEIVTKDLGILPPEKTGLVETIQAARTIVAVGTQSAPHVVVRSATPPFLLESDDESIRKLFPGAVVSLVHADVPGMATISCTAVSERERLSAAAAVATLKRAWAWDESPTITVTFESDGRAFRLNPTFEDGAWWVDAPA